jgi:tRNA(Ile2) C34 agmatinyltransferase TiaS
MRILVGFDDTDTPGAERGTGKLARWFQREIRGKCRFFAVLRQQLLLDPAIPFTSHNSAACIVVEMEDNASPDWLIRCAVGHIERHFLVGSDPGLCVVPENSPAKERLIAFGLRCTREVVCQEDAIRAARGTHLSGHGGSNAGIIGAAAAVGLTATGWCGRFIEFGALRELPDSVRVRDLEAAGIHVLSLDRDAAPPRPADIVRTRHWVRPRLLGHRPVLMVAPDDSGGWVNIHRKRRGGHHADGRGVSVSN